MYSQKINVGDAISVYWDGDKKWYQGQVLAVDDQGNCQVLYDDGEREELNLGDVKYRAGRNWKGCLREKKSRDGKDPLLKSIGDTLFDMEDRLPPKGVFKNQFQWWEKWHDSVSQAVDGRSIQDISKATLDIALQMKKNITTAWWHSHNMEWKKRLKAASTIFDIDLLVKELQIKVVDWSAARKLFGDAQEQEVKSSKGVTSVERTSKVNTMEPKIIAKVDGKSLMDSTTKKRLDRSRQTEQAIQSNDSSTGNVVLEDHDDKVVQKCQLPESKHMKIHTRQTRKRTLKDDPDKIQNDRKPVRTELKFDGDLKFCIPGSDVNGGESALTMTGNFREKIDEATRYEREVSLHMKERVDNSEKMAQHTKEDDEQFDLPIKVESYKSMETKDVKNVDDQCCMHVKGRNKTSEEIIQVAKQEREQHSLQPKGTSEGSDTTIQCTVKDTKQNNEQHKILGESKHGTELSPQQKDHNVYNEPASTSEKHVKREHYKTEAHLCDLQLQGQQMELMPERCSENEVGIRQKRLKLEMDPLPELRRSRRIEVKSITKKLSWAKNSAEDDNHLEGCDKFCNGFEDHGNNFNGESLKADKPHIEAEKKLKSLDKGLCSRNLISSNGEEAEGKGDSNYAFGFKSGPTEDGVSNCSLECSRGNIWIGKIKARRSKRVRVPKNVCDKPTVVKGEHCSIQSADGSRTLQMTRIKKACTISCGENRKDKSEDVEIHSLNEDIAMVQQGPPSIKACGGNSGAHVKEIELNHVALSQHCSVCQFGGADNLLLLCDGKGCSYSFHTFCIQPPLLMVPEGEWLCPYCKESSSVNGKWNKKGSRPYPPKKIEKILGRRQVQVGSEVNEAQLQYLVKWSSLSHHHDTWVPEGWILHHDRARLFNFQRKFPLNGHTLPVLVDLRKPEWLKIDRVIACREKVNIDEDSHQARNATQSGPENKGKYEFLVKWMGLDYSDATWEDSCNEELLGTVDKLVDRHQKANERVESDFGHLVAVSIKEQPSYLKGGILHGYQLQGLKWLLSNFEHRRNVILADEMGLGKTVQAIAFIACMKHEKRSSKPVLVIAPKSTLPGWDQEFRQWAPDLNTIIYQGDKESRTCIREHEFYSPKKRVLFDVLVTSFELAMVDNSILQKFKWSSIIVDEGHRIKNFRSKLGTLLKQQEANFRLLLTGTPLQNTLAELFALLHFLDPLEVPDPESAACAFSEIDTCSDQSDAASAHEKVSRIHELLQPRMLRRLKSEVLRDMLPGKRLVEVPCALTAPQRRLYVNLLKRNYKELNKGIRSGHKRSLNSLLIDLKMCCNHPYLFPGQEPENVHGEKAFKFLLGASGKLQLLEKLLPRLKQGGHRVLLFSQMTRMLDILEDFLSFQGFSYCRIDGSTPASERQQQIKNFNSPDSTMFVFLISTRAGGLGINLPTADTVIIYDPDFNPFVDMQAQSRAHRIGQVKSVIVYQLITKCSVEEKILQRSRRKVAMENLVMNPAGNGTFQELHTILLHGARNILDEQDIDATSIYHTDEEIEILLNRNIMAGEKDISEENGYLGSIQGLSMLQDEETKPVVDGKEWEELLGPLIEPAHVEEELGRGKRQRKEVRYACEPVSDDDEEYSPSASDGSSSSSMHEYTIKKHSDGEVTSLPETCLEQHEKKPEIGSSPNGQSGLGLRSSAASMSMGSGYSLLPSQASIALANSSLPLKPLTPSSLSGCQQSNLEGQVACVENVPSEANTSKCIASTFGEEFMQGIKQKMQSKLSETEHSLNWQDNLAGKGITLNGSTRLGANTTGHFPGGSLVENVQTQLVEAPPHGCPPLHVNHIDEARRNQLPLPISMQSPQASIYAPGKPSGPVQCLEQARKQQKVPHQPNLSCKEGPNPSPIPQDAVGWQSCLMGPPIGRQGIDPLISEINKMADAILERVSLTTPHRTGAFKASECVMDADNISGRPPSITNTIASPTLNHSNQNSHSVPKVDGSQQAGHEPPLAKTENNLS